MTTLMTFPEDLRKEMTFVPVERIDQVIAEALMEKPKADGDTGPESGAVPEIQERSHSR